MGRLCAARNAGRKILIPSASVAIAARHYEQGSTSPLAVSAALSLALGVEPREGEREYVTSLFADIKGSTELAKDLDPEEARASVDPALNTTIDAVHIDAAHR